jgi:hypothetical protein
MAMILLAAAHIDALLAAMLHAFMIRSGILARLSPCSFSPSISSTPRKEQQTCRHRDGHAAQPPHVAFIEWNGSSSTDPACFALAQRRGLRPGQGIKPQNTSKSALMP